ncbi:7830_t:CDS:1, partial [Dentiscutata heterogama]
SSSENLENNGNSVIKHDDRQKNILVITTSQKNNNDDIEFTKSQVVEQELTKELLSGIISALSISFEATEQISS